MWHQQSYSLRTFPLNDTAPRKVPPVTERQKFTKPKYWSFSEKDLDKSAGVLSSLSRVWLCATLWAVVHQAPLSIRFSRQEYWSGLPCPPLGDLPDPGIKPISFTSPSLAGGFLTPSTIWEALNISSHHELFLLPILQISCLIPTQPSSVTSVFSCNWKANWKADSLARITQLGVSKDQICLQIFLQENQLIWERKV